MHFLVNTCHIKEMDSADRLEDLIAQAVAARRFSSKSDFLRQAGFKSRGQINSWKARLRTDPTARIANISSMARLLGMSVEDFEARVFCSVGAEGDPYPSRQPAIDAARKLQLPETAIQIVLQESPGADPGRWYWFRRIEAEAARLAPISRIHG